MAYLGSNFFIILIFYPTVLKVNDAWLWPDEVESEIDDRSFVMTQTVLSSSLDDGLAIRQERPEIGYTKNPSFVEIEKTKRNSSVWRRLTPTTKRPAVHDQNSYSETNRNPSFTGTLIHSTIIDRDWRFPDEILNRRKSELKCAEYNKLIVEEQDGWINPLLTNQPATGMPPRKPTRHTCKGLPNPLIAGGSVSLPGEFSHMAAIGWLSEDNEVSFNCGGSLISDQWVITAAHCTHGPLGPPKFVQIGTLRLSDKTGKVIDIQTIVRHPSYKPPEMYGDLALIKLDKIVNIGSEIKPACLWIEFDDTPNKAWATGWGIMGIGEKQSDDLLKVRLNIVNNVDCAYKHQNSIAVPRGIVPSMLCAADIHGNWRGDTCQGDSGSPLQIFHSDYKCFHQIIGITSFGRLCAIRNSPGVYTRISHHIDWIEGIVWPDYY